MGKLTYAKNKTKYLCLRVTPALWEQVNLYCANVGISKQDFITGAIKYALEHSGNNS